MTILMSTLTLSVILTPLHIIHLVVFILTLLKYSLNYEVPVVFQITL